MPWSWHWPWPWPSHWPWPRPKPWPWRPLCPLRLGQPGARVWPRYLGLAQVPLGHTQVHQVLTNAVEFGPSPKAWPQHLSWVPARSMVNQEPGPKATKIPTKQKSCNFTNAVDVDRNRNPTWARPRAPWALDRSTGGSGPMGQAHGWPMVPCQLVQCVYVNCANVNICQHVAM